MGQRDEVNSGSASDNDKGDGGASDDDKSDEGGSDNDECDKGNRKSWETISIYLNLRIYYLRKTKKDGAINETPKWKYLLEKLSYKHWLIYTII